MFGRKKKDARSVTKFSDLGVGDLVVFKAREALPFGVSDETLTVEKVGTYDYARQLVSDFTLTHDSGLRISASYDDDEDMITIAYKLKRSQVLSIFNGDDFAYIFEDESDYTLEAQTDNISDELAHWVCDSYTPTLVAGSAYYYETDKRASGISADEDESTDFIFYELEGSNEFNSLSIEVWPDGETDVYCEITVKSNVIETFLNHA